MHPRVSRTPWQGVQQNLCCLAATLLLFAATPARAQYQRLHGGVGRRIDPGQLSSVGELRAIGGFNFVVSNPVLNLQYSPRSGPLPAAPLGMTIQQERQIWGRAVGAASPASRSMAVGRLTGPPTSMASRLRANEPVLLTDRTAAGMEDRRLGFADRFFAQPAFAANPAPFGGTRTPAPPPLPGADLLSNLPRGSALPPALARTTPVRTGVGEGGPATDAGTGPATTGEPAADEPPSRGIVVAERIDRRRDALLGLATELFRNQRYMEAYQAFTRAEAMLTETPDPQARKGRIAAAFATGQYRLAGQLLSTADTRVLEQADSVLAMYADRRAWDNHCGALQAYVSVSGRPAPEELALQAWVQWARGNLPEAMQTARRAISEDPTAVGPARLIETFEQGAPLPAVDQDAQPPQPARP